MTSLPNQITIEGETYVKKNCTWHKFPLSSTCLACQAGQPTIEEPKEWPQEGDDYFYVNGFGDIEEDYFLSRPRSRFQKSLMDRSNFFQTKEEAKMYSLRIESLSKGFMPEDGEKFWEWDFDDNKPTKWSNVLCSLFDPKFRTEEECQAWYDEYGKAWEYLLKPKK